MAVTAYGSISPTQAAYSAKTLLERALPFLILEQIGQMKPLPANNTKTIDFRRHRLTASVANKTGSNGEVAISTLANLNTGYQLNEGTSPIELATEMQSVPITLSQYGAVIGVTDVVEDTHIDDVLTEYMGVLGENAAQVIEAMRWLKLVSTTNVIFSGSATSDATVATAIGAAELRAAVRSIRANHGRTITRVVKSDARYGTQACEPSFIAVVNSDLEATLRKQLGTSFTPVADYGSSMTPLQGEFGNFENIRFLSSTFLGKRTGAGQAKAGATTMQNDGTNVNLYDVLVFGADAWAGVALKGEYAVTPMMVRATPTDSDPLAQRSKVGYKTMQGCEILQTAHIKKIVCASLGDAALA